MDGIKKRRVVGGRGGVEWICKHTDLHNSSKFGWPGEGGGIMESNEMSSKDDSGRHGWPLQRRGVGWGMRSTPDLQTK